MFSSRAAGAHNKLITALVITRAPEIHRARAGPAIALYIGVASTRKRQVVAHPDVTGGDGRAPPPPSPGNCPSVHYQSSLVRCTHIARCIDAIAAYMVQKSPGSRELLRSSLHSIIWESGVRWCETSEVWVKWLKLAGCRTAPTAGGNSRAPGLLTATRKICKAEMR